MGTEIEVEAEWRLIGDAPHAMHVLAARFDYDFGEWIYGVVFSPPRLPWTHWQSLPEPPRPNTGRV